VCLARGYLARLDELQGRQWQKSAGPAYPPVLADIRAALQTGKSSGMQALPRVAGVLRVLLGPGFTIVNDVIAERNFEADGNDVVASGFPRGVAYAEVCVAIGANQSLWVGANGECSSTARSGEPPPRAFRAWLSRYSMNAAECGSLAY
jgi:hypothetical protein